MGSKADETSKSPVPQGPSRCLGAPCSGSGPDVGTAPRQHVQSQRLENPSLRATRALKLSSEFGLWQILVSSVGHPLPALQAKAAESRRQVGGFRHRGLQAPKKTLAVTTRAAILAHLPLSTLSH